MNSESKQPTVEVRVVVSRKTWDLGLFSADYWRCGRMFMFTSALALPLGARLILIAANAPVVLRVALAW